MSVSAASVARAIWEDRGGLAQLARLSLTPASWLFGAIVAARNARFDRQPPSAGMLPCVSVGNLTVGGTGKTPVAAWCVQRLRERGARPAVVLRGVGDDEWRVHGLLNPGVPVVVSADRVAGVDLARARGAGCVVLDDAFQHRRASRVADIVLVSADRWTGKDRLLPAGPFREPLRALRRADVAVITVKAADSDAIDAVHQAITRAAPEVPCAVVRLVPGALRLAVTLGRTRSSDGHGADRHGADRHGADRHGADRHGGRPVRGRPARGRRTQQTERPGEPTAGLDAHPSGSLAARSVGDGGECAGRSGVV